MQGHGLVGNAPVSDAPTGVGTSEHGNARFHGRTHAVARRGVQPAHVRGVRREARGPIGDDRERVDVDERGNEGSPAFGHDADQLVGQPRAVLDAVDTGVEQVGQGLLGEGVDRDPRAGGVRPLDR